MRTFLLSVLGVEVGKCNFKEEPVSLRAMVRAALCSALWLLECHSLPSWVSSRWPDQPVLWRTVSKWKVEIKALVLQLTSLAQNHSLSFVLPIFFLQGYKRLQPFRAT